MELSECKTSPPQQKTETNISTVEESNIIKSYKPVKNKKIYQDLSNLDIIKKHDSKWLPKYLKYFDK
jgi:hypothetical protein